MYLEAVELCLKDPQAAAAKIVAIERLRRMKLFRKPRLIPNRHGGRCHDTFASPKKTYRKSGVLFWGYLNDRGSNASETPPLPDLIRAKAQSA